MRLPSPGKLLQSVLPKKTHFMGVDVGTHHIKTAEIKIVGGVPEIISLRRSSSPPGVWTDSFEEQKLVDSLKELAHPQLKEVVTCIGGEKVVSRIVRLPRMNDKEMEAAARFEIEKFVPTPLNQLIIRYIRLGSGERGQNVLLLSVPVATLYQYHGIFARAGMVVTALDLQAFALWRLYGHATAGALAIVDMGAQTSNLVIVIDGEIQFVRILPVGGNNLTYHLADAYGVEPAEAQQMKEEADVSMDSEERSPGVGRTREILRGGLVEITKELRRSLEFFTSQEGLEPKKLVLSGGTSKLRGLPGYLQEALQKPVEIGVPDIGLPGAEGFDTAFSVALGLALREAVK